MFLFVLVLPVLFSFQRRFRSRVFRRISAKIPWNCCCFVDVDVVVEPWTMWLIMHRRLYKTMTDWITNPNDPIFDYNQFRDPNIILTHLHLGPQVSFGIAISRKSWLHESTYSLDPHSVFLFPIQHKRWTMHVCLSHCFVPTVRPRGTI